MAEGPSNPNPPPDESRIAHLRGEEAVAVGRRLIRKYPEFTGGYELAARGYEDLGKPRNALRVLERGVAHRPHWRLLESLAIRYSEMGRYDEALAMLDDALGQAAGEPLLHYNLALVLIRVDRLDEALDASLRALDLDPEFAQASLLAAALECKLRHLEDAAGRLQATIDRLAAKEPPEREDPVLADAYRALAEIELAYKRREHAIGLFWLSIAHEKHNPASLYWIRELTGERVEEARYYRVAVRGRWPAGRPVPSMETRPAPDANEEAPGIGHYFETLYEVVAESPEEALALIQPCEPPAVRLSLRLVSAKVVKESVRDPKGVYRTSPYRWRSGP